MTYEELHCHTRGILYPRLRGGLGHEIYICFALRRVVDLTHYLSLNAIATSSSPQSGDHFNRIHSSA